MKKILIVEDDPKIAAALEVRLRANRYAVSVASDAPTGASLGRTLKPDLILLDISLPGGNGFHLAETFHRMNETKEAPIIFITAARTPEILQKVTDLGAAGLFEKPLDAQELLYSIQRELNRVESSNFRASAPSGSPRQPAQTSKQVLIIKDDEKIAITLALRVKAAGYEATTTYDALAGLEAAVRNPQDLVLLDSPPVASL